MFVYPAQVCRPGNRYETAKDAKVVGVVVCWPFDSGFLRVLRASASISHQRLGTAMSSRQAVTSSVTPAQVCRPGYRYETAKDAKDAKVVGVVVCWPFDSGFIRVLRASARISHQRLEQPCYPGGL